MRAEPPRAASDRSSPDVRKYAQSLKSGTIKTRKGAVYFIVLGNSRQSKTLIACK